MKKTDPKTTMFLHSEAKVEFFKKYLERYIRIIGLSGQFNEINIFDVFCGTGVYDNGKKGSPIAAFEAIKSFRKDYPSTAVTINLFVNDSASKKVEVVKNYIEAENVGCCDVYYTTDAADVTFKAVANRLNQQDGRCRNLVFVDPYGYKEIDRKALEELLRNGRTEIILFLPISHMQRFTAKAMDSDEAPYVPLRNFVASFFPPDHPIQSSTLSLDDYIQAVKEAVKFGTYYSTSFVIERDASIRYALFFVTPHIYGYEKILEVKWQMDEDEGRGFSQPEVNPSFSLFKDEERRIVQEENYERLEKLLRDFLEKPRTNSELYEKTLEQEFLPRHANQVLRRWQDDACLEVIDLQNGKPARKGSFYLTWDCYKQNLPRARFTLKKS